MLDIYTTFYNKWKSGGGTLVNQYVFCDDGWGWLTYMDQDTSQAPGYLAGMHFIRSNPRWWTETRDACDVGVPACGPGQVTPPVRLSLDLRTGKPVITVRGSVSNVRLLALDGRMTPVAVVRPATGTTEVMPAGWVADGLRVLQVRPQGTGDFLVEPVLHIQ